MAVYKEPQPVKLKLNRSGRGTLEIDGKQIHGVFKVVVLARSSRPAVVRIDLHAGDIELDLGGAEVYEE